MFNGIRGHERVVLCATLTLSACASFATAPAAQSSRGNPIAAQSILSDSALAVHLLNRLAFGPRPGDVDRVLTMGTSSWIEQQLNATNALDGAAVRALTGCNMWTEDVVTAESRLSGLETFENAMMNGVRIVTIGVQGLYGIVTRDSAMHSQSFGGLYLANGQLVACRLARLEASENQLLEVMTDFWHNHFSFFGALIPTRGSIIAFDRVTVRPKALGHFRDLLGAVAHSPAMLEYLDNAMSQADTNRRTLVARTAYTGLNENYARELLELHTLGADGGYTQQDVIEVARALTGWSHSRSDRRVGAKASLAASPAAVTTFVFDSSVHDAEAKVVLGHPLAAGRGVEDGEEVLDILARHPATARFIARKLAVRFISDDPPQSIIDRAAETFTRTDGDIREVVRTIVTSPEFQSPKAVGAKTKNPLEFVLSLRRIFSAPADSAAEEIDFLVLLNQTPYGHVAPDGWPETGAAWVGAGSMMTRLRIIDSLASGSLASIPLERWPLWQSLATAAFDEQLSGVVAGVLSGQASPTTRRVLASLRPQGVAPADSTARTDLLRQLIVLALASPDFQRR